MSVLSLEAKLERVDSSTPWGFRMQGGKDFSSALTIQRVNPGSLAAKCGLQVGDIILKIGNIGTDILKHKDAQDMIIASGDKLDLLLQRGGQQNQPTYEKFNTPSIYSLQNQPSTFSSQQNYNAAPKPFTPGGGSAVDNLSGRLTQGLSLNSNAPGSTGPGPQPPWAQSKPSGGHTWQPAPQAPSAGMKSAPAARPGGQGPTRGKKGDAKYQSGGQVGRQPVCSACGNAVRGPFVMAMGKTWCPDHFVCANPQCGIKLIDIGFVEEGGFLYCERDYAQHFAPHCKKCNGAIIGECVNALSGQWHPGCFVCYQCKKPIGGESFHQEDGHLYCEDDWNMMFQTMCHACDFPIEPGDRWVEAISKNWHAECFNCQHCQVNLEGQPFFPKAGKPYCKKHTRP